ncbi:MAG TPA: hypothetical protein VMG08_13935 [Allosphingosinicella sp.]|nr:hypothetical protein [Allosphingosinicella sp.]
MNRPGLWIVIGLLATAAGLALGWSGLRLASGLPVWEANMRAWQTISFLGFLATLGGLVLAGIAYAVLRKRNALRSGTGLLASWRVGMLDWATFRRRDTARDGLFHSLRNRLRLPAALPPEGMEIRIGTDAMLIGDACYGLGYFASRGKLVDIALVEGQPAMLEFVTFQQGKGHSRLAVFRIPSPEGARAEAREVLDHFNATIDPRRRESVRSHYAPHYRAAGGDAGEAEAARTEDRLRGLRAFGFAGLLCGGIMLAIILTRTPGPYVDLDGIRMLTIGGIVAVVAGLGALLVAILARRPPL